MAQPLLECACPCWATTLLPLLERCVHCCCLVAWQATKLLKEKLEAVLAEAHKRVDSETFTDVHWRGASLPVKSDRLRTAITSAIEKSKQLRCGAVWLGGGPCGEALCSYRRCACASSRGLGVRVLG